MENFVFHPAATRGHANHGWLESYHTFSFANYYEESRMHFGALRVLNDDKVSQGRGFGTHPHHDMEIISIPLEGDLEHKDSMGNTTVIRKGDVQVMSAGTGIYHSEYNRNKDQQVKFLQIWVIPNKKLVAPRYGQISLEDMELHNVLKLVVSPDPKNGDTWIHQDAWFYLGKFDGGQTYNYTLKTSGNGIYIFVLAGKLNVGEQTLSNRDGMGVWNKDKLQLSFQENSEVLLMEVPMNV